MIRIQKILINLLFGHTSKFSIHLDISLTFGGVDEAPVVGDGGGAAELLRAVAIEHDGRRRQVSCNSAVTLTSQITLIIFIFDH